MGDKSSICITSSSFFGCCLCWSMFAFALMYTLGFEARRDFNNRLEETTCTVESHEPGIIRQTCTEDCNCRNVPDGSGGTRRVCDTCSFPCYDARLTVNYTILDGRLFSSVLQVANNQRRRSSAQSALDSRPIGYQLLCLYDRDNPEDVRTEEINTDGFLAGSIIFAVFAGCGFCGLVCGPFFIFGEEIVYIGESSGKLCCGCLNSCFTSIRDIELGDINEIIED
jgi:hypothetical protein